MNAKRLMTMAGVVFAVSTVIVALLACAPRPQPPSPLDIQVIETEPHTTAASTIAQASSTTNAELVNRLIECYKTNDLIWAATEGIMEMKLAAAGYDESLDPEDMRPFLEGAALESPAEFRLNGLATLRQCAATNPERR